LKSRLRYYKRKIFKNYFILGIIFKLPHLIVLSLKFPFKLFFLNRTIKTVKNNRKIVAVSLTKKIGDIISCEPIVRKIRYDYKESFIIWFTETKYKELIDENPNVNMVQGLHCLSEWILFKYFIKFDMVCDFHFHGKTCCILSIVNDEGNKEIDHNNYFNFGTLLDIYSLTSGFIPIDHNPKFYIASETIPQADKLKLPDTYLVIHCESDSKQKGWGKENWTLLLNFILNELNLYVVDVGANPKPDLVKNPNYKNLCGISTLFLTAELIKRASLFIGNDSGPAHIANALDTYGIILMGDYYHFKNYQPFSGDYFNGNMATIIRANGYVKNLPVQTVKSFVKDVSKKIIKKA